MRDTLISMLNVKVANTALTLKNLFWRFFVILCLVQFDKDENIPISYLIYFGFSDHI